MKQSTSNIFVCAVVLIFSCDANAQGGKRCDLVQIAYDKPEFALEGSIDDIVLFSAELQRISANSPSFSELLDEIACQQVWDSGTKVLTRPIPIYLARNAEYMPADMTNESIGLGRAESDRDANAIHAFSVGAVLSRRLLRLGMNNVDKFPHWEQVGGGWQVSNRKPPWATTREAIIVHEIAEFWNGIKNGEFDYAADHAVALKLENSVRREFGQMHGRGKDTNAGNKTEFPLGPHKEIWTINAHKLVDIGYVPGSE